MRYSDSLARLGVTKEWQAELVRLSLTYRDMRALAHAMAQGSGPVPSHTGGTRPSGVARPVESALLRREALLRAIRDIEAAAREAGGDEMAPLLLRYMTSKEKTPLDFMPCGRRQFYTLRERYLLALYARRKGVRKPRDIA